jgi:hypothetical protein
MNPSRARRAPRVLLLAGLAAFVLAEWPVVAAGPPDRPTPALQSQAVRPVCVAPCEALARAAQQAFTGIDVEVLVDEALRAVMAAGETIEVGDIVTQAIEEARVQAALRALFGPQVSSREARDPSLELSSFEF